MRFRLKRINNHKDGVFGVGIWDGLQFCVTLEHSYSTEHFQHIAKLPPGTYQCSRTWFNRGGYDTWLITGGVATPDRRLLFHKGNWESDTDGCVLLGESYGTLNGKPAVISSGQAFTEFMHLTKACDKFDMLIGEHL